MKSVFFYYLTIIAGRIARAKLRQLTTFLIYCFVRIFKVNMSEAEQSDIRSYGCFNDFFTRKLHKSARIFQQSDFTSPVDGAISQLGDIDKGRLLQVKGCFYTLSELLTKDDVSFSKGQFITLYLSPRDYHRVHIPCSAKLLSMTYVPGRLYGVGHWFIKWSPQLFSQNERVICEFEADFGRFYLIFVGAMIVGSIATTWAGIVNWHSLNKFLKKKIPNPKTWEYATPLPFQQGDEIGQFLLGSTVILLFPPNIMKFNESWQAGKSVRLGEPMGECL